MIRSVSSAVLAFALFANPQVSHAQQSSSATPGGLATPVDLIAQRVDELNINLDGRVDEAIWGTATPITDFTQQEPVEGGQPSERTEIRVLFDENNLYMGVIIYDDPDEVLAFQRERDAALSTDDRFMWIFDTFRDGRTGYFFEINAAGLMGDGVLTGGGGGRGGFGGGGANKAWDGIWEARTAMRPDGWSAEIQIPFRTLNFDPAETEWSINFQRTIRRRNEEILWRGWRRTEGLRNPVFAGTLSGLSGMSQGLGLEAIPSAIANYRNVPSNTDPTTYPRDVSLDVNYSITSSLRASASVNTDFAEVESDNRRVNLTRFPVRFPEQRDFFLEGSGVFSFAPRSGPTPFFSRNIGLRSGQQVPITYGTRLTGQAGAFNLGFYQIGTGDHTYFDEDDLVDVTIPKENFTVGRVQRQLGEQSAIGAIYTRRATSLDLSGEAPIDRHTAGVDLDFKTRNFLGNKNLELEAFFVWNSNPLASDDTDYVALSTEDLSAHGFRLNYPNDIWTSHVSYRQFGDDYRPAAGFVTRNNFRRIEPRIGWAPRTPGISWLRRVDFSVQLRELVSLDSSAPGNDPYLLGGRGGVQERQWQFNVLGMDFESGDGFDIQVTNTYEYLDQEFSPSEGITVVPGNYTINEYRISGRTAGRRRVSLFGGVTKGGFWDGDRLQYGGRVGIRPKPGVSVSTNFQRNEVSMPGGDFTASLYELETDWTPSPWVAVTGQLQYDDQSDIVGFFARLRWIVKPGNDVFLVLTQNWRRDPLDQLDPNSRYEFNTLSRGAAIKANYTYRF
ncbi:MAG: DUF5916 domain-containing protein [Gemmatimonadota bacterium]